MKVDVSIVMLTWNRASYLKIGLKKLFASLSPESKLSHEIIFMDNGSTDDTLEVISEYESLPYVRIIKNKENLGLNAYKKLFCMARGKYIIELDDDVLDFPVGFDVIMVDYLEHFRDYGYLSLNVIQDEKTNGAKPDMSNYCDDVRGARVVEEGPNGGWCAIFRRKYLFLLVPILWFYNIKMKMPEDALLVSFFARLKLRHGIIKEAKCLHACGPVYAKEFRRSSREVEKYEIGGLPQMGSLYK